MEREGEAAAERWRSEMHESAELWALLEMTRGQLDNAESQRLSWHQKNEKLSLILKARDRSLDENCIQLQQLTSELRDAEYASADMANQLSLEEQRCERRTEAYKVKNISFHRCKDALIQRTDELSEAQKDLQHLDRRRNQLAMALEDRDVIDSRGAAVSIGRTERPLLLIQDSKDE